MSTSISIINKLKVVGRSSCKLRNIAVRRGVGALIADDYGGGGGGGGGKMPKHLLRNM